MEEHQGAPAIVTSPGGDKIDVPSSSEKHRSQTEAAARESSSEDVAMMEHDGKVSVPRTAAAGAGEAGEAPPTSPDERPPTAGEHDAPPSEDVAMEEVKVGAPSPRAARSPLQERSSPPGTANTQQRTKTGGAGGEEDATRSSKRADASPSRGPKKAKQQRRHDRDEQSARDELDSALDALQEVSSAETDSVFIPRGPGS